MKGKWDNENARINPVLRQTVRELGTGWTEAEFTFVARNYGFDVSHPPNQRQAFPNDVSADVTCQSGLIRSVPPHSRSFNLDARERSGRHALIFNGKEIPTPVGVRTVNHRPEQPR